MARRSLTKLKDSIVLSYLRSIECGKRKTWPTAPQIRDAINATHGALVSGEEVYNSLTRLERIGEVKRWARTKRTVQWRPTRRDSLLVAEPRRTLRQP